MQLNTAEQGGRRHLHDNTQIHDSNTVTHVINHTQIMGNDQTGKIKGLLEVTQEIQHLGLNRHIKGTYRLVSDNEAWVKTESPGNTDPLPLAT